MGTSRLVGLTAEAFVAASSSLVPFTTSASEGLLLLIFVSLVFTFASTATVTALSDGSAICE